MSPAGVQICGRILLNTPVRFRSSDVEALDRFSLCYQAFPSFDANGEGDGTTDVIEASLEPTADGYVANVTGRSERKANNLIDANRALNHELLHALMRRNPRFFYLHAGVVQIGGRAIVLPGLSGAGKSTLVLKLVQQGARLLTDELFVFDPASALVHPFPRAPKIRDVCTGYFSEFEGTFVGRGEGRFLPVPFLPGGIEHEPMPIGLFVFPQYEANLAEPTVRDLSSGQLLLEATQAALNFGTHKRQSIDHLIAMCRGVKGLVIHWSEPESAVERIRGALA